MTHWPSLFGNVYLTVRPAWVLQLQGHTHFLLVICSWHPAVIIVWQGQNAANCSLLSQGTTICTLTRREMFKIHPWLFFSIFLDVIFFYLQFKCYPLSWFSLQKTLIPFPFTLLTSSLTLLYPSIPLHLGIKPSQDQRPLFPLMSNKIILGYICCWSHGLLHVYSSAGGLVAGSSVGSGWIILLFLLWGWNLTQLLSFLLIHWRPHAQSNGWLKAFNSVAVRFWQSLSGDSCIRLLSTSTCWHPHIW